MKRIMLLICLSLISATALAQSRYEHHYDSRYYHQVFSHWEDREICEERHRTHSRYAPHSNVYIERHRPGFHGRIDIGFSSRVHHNSRYRSVRRNNIVLECRIEAVPVYRMIRR